MAAFGERSSFRRERTASFTRWRPARRMAGRLIRGAYIM